MKQFFPLISFSVILLSCGSPASFSRISTESLSTLTEGKPSVVNFWASWCSICNAELPHFESVSKQYTDVQFVGVNLQESASTVERFWKMKEITFPTVIDPHAALKKQFEVFTQPTTFILDAEGNILFRRDGPISEKELSKEVQRISDIQIEQISPPPPDTSLRSSPVPPHLTSWYEGDVSHIIPLEEILSGGPQKDGIPSIDSPQFIPLSDAAFLKDDDIGVLLTIGDDIRFYPFRILNWHEIVNDTVGGEAVAITYCPLCGTAVVYERNLSTGMTEFGVSGFLFQSNLLMYDRASDSLWNQATAQSVAGPRVGMRLMMVPSNLVHVSTLKGIYPHAKVLSTETGNMRRYEDTPYKGYETSDLIMFPVRAQDDRLFSKELVYGIVIGGQPKAYPFDLISEKNTIEDSVAGTRITITYDTQTEDLTFQNAVTGGKLTPLPVFWFSWVAQYPNTDVYE